MQQKNSSLLLPSGTLRLGGSSSYGLSNSLNLGTDLVPLVAGARNINVKAEVYGSPDTSVTLGLETFHVTRASLLGGAQKKLLETLDLSSVHPRLILTRRLSERLLTHAAWEGGRNWGDLALSEEGKQRQRQSQRQGLFADQSILLMALLGFTQESFEVSGEWQRSPHETLLLAAHIARYQLEDLKAQHFGVRIAQQWQGENIGFRLGAGALYQDLDGVSLVGETLQEGRVLPVAEFDFFLLMK